MTRNLAAALILLTISASNAASKCFSQKVAAVAYSSSTHFGEIVSLKKTSRGCELTVNAEGAVLSGVGSPGFCNTRPGVGIAFRTQPHCCDQPPCPGGTRNEIIFKLPREEGSHRTVGEIFDAKPEDIRITIRKWSDYGRIEQRSDFGQKEIEQFREDLRTYVEISDAEKESMYVSFIGMGVREGEMTFPDGTHAVWKQLHFLEVRNAMAGAKARPLTFAPRPWLKSIQW